MTVPKFSAISDDSVSGIAGAGTGTNAMMSNRSMLKDFLGSIATMTGDLSNITAPPFVLDTKSVVEIPAFWAENPAIFVSPALSDDPAERALLILKSFLGGMKSQCYMGHSEETGVRKPLNAFLGELFMAHWEDELTGRTQLLSEQVSHHPPITACRVWNEKHGVVAEGYNKQKVTLSWSSMSVNISSTGFALKTLEKYNEAYLLPLPDFRVKGVLSGAPYPETNGTWYIPSTNGYMSVIRFTGGKSFFGAGQKHEFSAALYHEDEGEKHALYTIHGCWNTEFTIRDERTGRDIEIFNVTKMLTELPKMHVAPIEEQDPWESRRAWHDTVAAINAGEMKSVTEAKSDVEQGQREMRKDEHKNGVKWTPLFYSNSDRHDVVQQLMTKLPGSDFTKIKESTNGIWLFNAEAYKNAQQPYHPDLNPNNLREGEERRTRRSSSVSSASSFSRPSSRTSRDFGARGSVDLGRKSIDHSRLRNDSTPRGSVDIRTLRSSNLVPNGEANGSGHKTATTVASPDTINNSTSTNTSQQSLELADRSSRHSRSDASTDQVDTKEKDLQTGIESLSISEKTRVENMLRDKYSSNA